MQTKNGRNEKGQFIKGGLTGKNHPNWKGGWKNKLPKCEMCGKKLTNRYAKRCHKHQEHQKRIRTFVGCPICNKKFETWPPHIKRVKTKYCSRECANKAKKGKPAWNKGRKGLQSWMNISGLRPHKKGEYKHSEKTLKKMSEVHKGHIPWNKGKGIITSKNERIRDSIQFRSWREVIFARDNYICQKCSQQGMILHPHHIFSFADYLELRFAIDNGITFCKGCHKKFHKLFGQRNNTRKQLSEFLS